MRYFIFYFTLFLFWSFIGIGQTTNVSGIINSYVGVTQLGSGPCIDSIYVITTAGFTVNDTVLLIQMKGAGIDTTNTTNFGTILNYNSAGNYEFGTIKSVGPNLIVLNNSLSRTYSPNGQLQLVRVPHYNDAIVTGVLTSQLWNGNIGGILAFTAVSSVTLSANIDVSGKGFKGGDASIDYYTNWFTPYYCTGSSGRGGYKGEGISTVSLLQEAGRGANSCGGGGGSDINTGAGGGGNGGAGGHGGNNFFAPSFLWGDGGKTLDQSIGSDKLFLGGGGGGGHQNNSEGTDGADGGGIVIIRTNNITGNGFSINANGNDVVIAAGIDGAGGGGAGGTIVIDAQNYIGNLTINAKGGKGGDQFYPPQCHGNGGGGGGGAIKKTGGVGFPANVLTYVNGGIRGSGQCNGTVNDAINGSNGLIVPNLSFPAITVPVADAGPDQIICSGESVQIGGMGQPGLIYNWSNGAGSIPNPTVTPAVSTTYILTVSQTGTCPVTDTDSVTITVIPSPQASYNYTVDCSGLLVSFNNNSTGNTSNFWNFGDGFTSMLASPVHLFPDTGWYNVQLIISNIGGCNDTLNQFIYLDLPQYPTALFTADTIACSLDVLFISNSVNATGLIWSFGDGDTSTLMNPVHTYGSPGNYTANLIATNTCGSDTLVMQITIDPITLPLASFVSDTTHCSSVVSFTNNSLNATSFIWNFGNGTSSTQVNPVCSYTIAGIYNVSLIANGGCGSDTIIQVLVIDNFEPPVAAFTPEIIPCDSTITFTNISQNGMTYLWSFGDGDTSTIENPVHTYITPGVYNVILISSNECGIDTSIVPLNLALSALPFASFLNEILACSSLVAFSNTSINDFEWYWDFGDGTFSNEENPEHLYEEAGVYEVLLIVNESSGCQDSATATIFIDDISINGLFIPNVFTPNNDSKNEKFDVESIALCDTYSIAIYNRWGQVIFESSDIRISWDGKHNGINAPEGVYFYVIRGGRDTLYGTVSIIR